MTRSVWLKADDAVGDWDDRRKRITAGLEAGVDWVLVDAADVDRVRELGDVNVAAFSDGDVQVIDEAEPGAEADAYIVGKDGELATVSALGSHEVVLASGQREFEEPRLSDLRVEVGPR